MFQLFLNLWRAKQIEISQNFKTTHGQFIQTSTLKLPL